MASKRTKILGGLAALAAAMITTITLLTPSGIVNTRTGTDYGTDLQTAINEAVAGDTIILQANVTYTGPITLPVKSGATFITLQTSALEKLPNARITPAQSSLLAKIVSPGSNEPVLKTAPSSHHYRLIGIEFAPVDANAVVSDLVKLGDGSSAQNSLSLVPSNFILDRVFIHGFPTQEVKRGVALNSADTEIINSWISDIHGTGYDTQAICGWNGPGPYKILNNYLEAAGENVMFGGADPSIDGLIPSDIQIKQNHFFKPFTWKVGHPSYAGKHWTIKNLFETKNVRRIIVEGNLFENNWTDGQAGFGILIKCNNQDSTAPWSVTEDLLFQYNIVRSERGLNMLLIENPPKVSAIGKRIYIRHNFFEVEWTVFQGPNSGEDVQFEHNTWTKGGGNNFTMYGQPTKGFVFRNNLGPYVGFGFRGDGEGVGAGVQEGTATFNAYSPGTWVFEGNVIAGANPNQYPTKNFYPATWEEVQVDANYKLLLTSPYKGKATDGKDPGVDWDALMAAQAKPVINPTPSVTATVAVSPSPSVSPTSTPIQTPTPVPTVTISPSPVVTPRPSPVTSPTPALPFCRAGERPGNPPKCQCRSGFIGNSGKCR